MRLSELMAALPAAPAGGAVDDVEIAAVVSDSRQVVPGALFVAIRGQTADGHAFAHQAVDGGAAALVVDDPAFATDAEVPVLRVPDSRQALAWLCAAWYGFPARRLKMIGVTGTDGKTTTCHLIHAILRAARVRAGLMTSVRAEIDDRELDTGLHVTTPDAPAVQSLLARMQSAGLTHAVLETTSHGWAQHRSDACEFDVGVMTNFSAEHLDYHGTPEAYLAAKSRLFSGLDESVDKGAAKVAVLNRDDPSFETLRDRTDARVVTYGERGADWRAIEVSSDARGLRFIAVGPGMRLPVESPLLGEYNVWNALAAIAATVGGLNVSPEAVVDGLAGMRGVPGRMERVDVGQDFVALVDFAHTPNALARALQAARKLTLSGGRVVAVFGSAGLRDRDKRRRMGEVAVGLADRVVLTAEDPRTESLEVILDEMAAGCVAAGGREGRTFWRVPDRREALRLGVSMARPNGLVIACGKGHEQSMCYGETEVPWDDRTALQAALAEELGVPGPAMPRLPVVV